MSRKKEQPFYHRATLLFHPVNTVDSLSQMFGHNAIVGGAIVVCHGVTR